MTATAPAPWRLAGEFIVSCSCDWCPCAISLGRAQPTEGWCHSWFAFRLDEGVAGDVALGGLNLAVLLEVPGKMADGNYVLGLYLDERGSAAQRAALEQIFRGQAGGPTGWWRWVIGTYLGARTVPITYAVEGPGRRVTIPKVLDANIDPEIGPGQAAPMRIVNMAYWMAPEVVLARGTRSRIRDWGRVWDLSGQSAEFGAFAWHGP